MRHFFLYQSVPQLQVSVRTTMITETQCVALFAQAARIKDYITDQPVVDRITRLVHDAIAQLDKDGYIASIFNYHVSVSPISEPMPSPQKNDTLLVFEPTSELITVIEQIDLADEITIYSSESYHAGQRYAEVNWPRQQAPIIEARKALIYGEFMMGYYENVARLQQRVLEAYRLHGRELLGKYIIHMTPDPAKVGEVRNIAHPEASFQIMAECILSQRIDLDDSETGEYTGTTYRTIWTLVPSQKE